MRDESERDFTLRLLQKMVDFLNGMRDATKGMDIRFDVPPGKQFDATTLDALPQAMDDDGELEDKFVAMDHDDDGDAGR